MMFLEHLIHIPDASLANVIVVDSCTSGVVRHRVVRAAVVVVLVIVDVVGRRVALTADRVGWVVSVGPSDGYVG